MACTVRRVGTSTPVISANSTTAARSTSSSSGLPRSRSWSVEVRWSPTFSAPASRLFDGDADLAAEGLGDRERLGHHDLDDLAGAAVQAHLPHGGAGQRADRVERDVAEQLEPDVVAQVGFDRALQTTGDHGLAEVQAALGHAAVGLADGEPGAFQVPYDTGAFELGRGVDDAADGPFGGEHRTDRAVRVHALDAVAVVGSAVAVEVPPGDAVLGGHDGRRVVQQWFDQRPARRVRVGLQAQEDEVDRADLGRVVGGVGARGEVTARTEHAHSVLPHGREMRSTGDQVHVGTRAMQRGSDVGADGTGAEDCNFHFGTLRSVEGVPRRWLGSSGIGEWHRGRILSTEYCLQYG